LFPESVRELEHVVVHDEVECIVDVLRLRGEFVKCFFCGYVGVHTHSIAREEHGCGGQGLPDLEVTESMEVGF